MSICPDWTAGISASKPMLLNSILLPICLMMASARSRSKPTYLSSSVNSNGGNVVSEPTRITAGMPPFPEAELDLESPPPHPAASITAEAAPTANRIFNFLPSICFISTNDNLQMNKRNLHENSLQIQKSSPSGVFLHPIRLEYPFPYIT